MMLELLEQAASVQREDMAVLAMHVVGIMHESKEFGSQQPWTPFWMIVAQAKFGLEHVIEDSTTMLVGELVGLGDETYAMSPTQRRMYYSPVVYRVWRLRNLVVELPQLVLGSRCQVQAQTQ